jgi:hypothetical protein
MDVERLPRVLIVLFVRRSSVVCVQVLVLKSAMVTRRSEVLCFTFGRTRARVSQEHISHGTLGFCGKVARIHACLVRSIDRSRNGCCWCFDPSSVYDLVVVCNSLHTVVRVISCCQALLCVCKYSYTCHSRGLPKGVGLFYCASRCIHALVCEAAD